MPSRWWPAIFAGVRRACHQAIGIRTSSSQKIARCTSCTVATFQKKLCHQGSSMKASAGTSCPFISGNVL